MARKRRGRAISGVLLLNKPLGLSSNHALQRVKRHYFAQKAGHTGSLDPLATGVLPICLGEATKFSQYLLDADKRYRSIIRFGISTASGDRDGDILQQTDTSELQQADIEAVLGQFRGPIKQVPSMYSALKKDGRPLYELARQGIEVERKARDITIFELNLLSFEAGDRASCEIEVHCSKGTYIRSLAEDIGKALGCGAHVEALHRTAAGDFAESGAYDLEQLEALKQDEQFDDLDALLLPTEVLLKSLPKVEVTPDSAYYVRQGNPVIVPHMPVNGMVQIHEQDGALIGVGEILDDGRVAPRRLVVTQSE